MLDLPHCLLCGDTAGPLTPWDVAPDIRVLRCVDRRHCFERSRARMTPDDIAYAESLEAESRPHPGPGDAPEPGCSNTSLNIVPDTIFSQGQKDWRAPVLRTDLDTRAPPSIG